MYIAQYLKNFAVMHESVDTLKPGPNVELFMRRTKL